MDALFEALFTDEKMESVPFITDYIIQPRKNVYVRINRKWQVHPDYKHRPSEEEVSGLIKETEGLDVVRPGSNDGDKRETFLVGGVTFHRNNFSFEIADKEYGNFRYRMHISNELNGVELNIRVLRSRDLDARNLGFTPEIIQRLLSRKTGLIVVAGKTGSGKSTTMAALVHELPMVYPESRLITVESPVEYPLDDIDGLHVAQRQVGMHVKSFKRGIRNIKRESADFALVGEIQKEEEIAGVFEAASAGHLVLTTCHAETLPKALDFLRRGGPPEVMQQRIATYLNAIIVQELVPSRTAGLCYPSLAYEILFNGVGTPITSALRQGKWDNLEFNEAQGLIPMRIRLEQLVRENRITREDADKVRPRN